MLLIIGVFKVNVEFCLKTVFVTYGKCSLGLSLFPNLNSTLWSHWYRIKPLSAPNTNGMYLLDYSVVSYWSVSLKITSSACWSRYYVEAHISVARKSYCIAWVLRWHSNFKPDIFFQNTLFHFPCPWLRRFLPFSLSRTGSSRVICSPSSAWRSCASPCLLHTNPQPFSSSSRGWDQGETFEWDVTNAQIKMT